MPNIASAKKNLRKSRRRQKARRAMAEKIQKLLKMKAGERGKTQSLIDKAAKRGIYHKNKAARLVSKLNRAK